MNGAHISVRGGSPKPYTHGESPPPRTLGVEFETATGPGWVRRCCSATPCLDRVSLQPYGVQLGPRVGGERVRSYGRSAHRSAIVVPIPCSLLREFLTVRPPPMRAFLFWHSRPYVKTLIERDIQIANLVISGATCEKVANEFHLTRERVRQIVKKECRRRNREWFAAMPSDKAKFDIKWIRQHRLVFSCVDGNSSQQSHKGANHGQALQRQKASEEVLKSRESFFFSSNH